MTRKDFERIAKIINDQAKDVTTGISDRVLLNELANKFADNFKAENPRFDRDRFMRACSLDDLE